MKNISKLFSALCALAFITTTSAVYASSAPVILNLEGNPTCSALVQNIILEERDTSVADEGVEKTLIFANGQELIYRISTTNDPGDTIEEWYLLEPPLGFQGPVFPVNFVIGKGAGNAGAIVFHYGEKGVTADSDLVGPGTLKTITICYGLNEEPIGAPETVQRCEELDGGNLNEVGIVCPTVGDYSIHTIKKGERFEYDECTCNETAKVCDKSLPAGAIGACVYRCPDSGYPVTDPNGNVYISKVECLEANQLRETPGGAIVPWNNGSGWCSSVLGSIGCKTW